MATIYRFGPFRLDAVAETLFRGDEPAVLGRRAVALLRLLLERAGSPVSKDALIETAWPGLAVEDSNLTVQIAALRRVFEAAAGGAAWIETLPRRGYRYVGPAVTTGDPPAAAGPQPSLPPALPDKPSIAVLAFSNLSGDPEQEYFADGVVEEIITALSRMSWLFVIARNSSFTFKGRAVDVKQVGRDLGARYVLEGSVRKAAGRVRITGQLVDSLTGSHLWADRFEGALADIFELQDEVTISVVGAIAPKLEKAEIERAKRKPTGNLDAYDYYLRAMASVYQWTEASLDEALRLFYRAIDIDGDFAAAYGMAARCYNWRATNGWVTDKAKEIAEATRLARRAAELGRDDAVALATAGFATARVVGDLDAGADLIARALALNPNLAAAWLSSGWVKVWSGEPEGAIEHFSRAMRLSPLDPQIFNMQTGIAAAHFIAGRYETASAWTDKAMGEQANFAPTLRIAAASKALGGHHDEAVKAVLRLRQIDPAARIANVHERTPYRRPDDLLRLKQGLRAAGLPE